MESAFGDAGKCPRRGSQLLKKSPLHSSCPYRGVRGWRSRRSGLRPQMSKVVGVWRRAWLTARLRVQKETAAFRGGRFILYPTCFGLLFALLGRFCFGVVVFFFVDLLAVFIFFFVSLLLFLLGQGAAVGGA